LTRDRRVLYATRRKTRERRPELTVHSSPTQSIGPAHDGTILLSGFFLQLHCTLRCTLHTQERGDLTRSDSSSSLVLVPNSIPRLVFLLVSRSRLSLSYPQTTRLDFPRRNIDPSGRSHGIQTRVPSHKGCILVGSVFQRERTLICICERVLVLHQTNSCTLWSAHALKTNERTNALFCLPG